MGKNYKDQGRVSVIVGENIRRFRRKYDYSQEYVAEKLDVSLSTYSRMERGIAPVNVIRLKRLSEILRVSYEELFLEQQII